MILIDIYLGIGVASIIGKFWSSRIDRGANYKVTTSNWWKTIVLWPVELKKLLNNEEVF